MARGSGLSFDDVRVHYNSDKPAGKGRFWNAIRQVMEVKPEGDLAGSTAGALLYRMA